MDDNIMGTLTALGLVFTVIYCSYKKLFKVSEDHSWREDVHVVTNREQCHFSVKRLKLHSRNISLLGFECKWEKANGCRRTISSLILSTFNGLIVIFQLDQFNAIPHLKELLEDDSIVKIGVDTQRQALYLFNDFDVRVSSTFDLFYMARAAGYFDPMKLRTVLRYYIQMTAQINPHYPFDDDNEEGLAESARGGILLFRSFSSELQSKERPYVVKNIIDTYCLPYLGFFYGIDGSIHSNTRIYFKRLKSVETKYGTTYKLPERNKCTYCQESGSYCTYFPYVFECFWDDKVLVLCEPCHRSSRHSSWWSKVNLIIQSEDVPFGENCTTLNLNNVPIMTMAQVADTAKKIDELSSEGHSINEVERQLNVELPIQIVVDPQHLTYVVINDSEDCRYWLKDLTRHCKEIPTLSLDCEWVSIMGERKPIALLQLATCQGLCLLIRLCHIKVIPNELRAILSNKEIIKVGVDVHQDAEYLLNDYHVTVANTLDLRFMAEIAGCVPGGLAKMAAKYISIKMDKEDYRIHRTWESPKLTPFQISYASNDAWAGMLLFKYFAYKMQQSIVMDYAHCLRIEFMCKKFIDKKYKSQSKKLPK